MAGGYKKFNFEDSQTDVIFLNSIPSLKGRITRIYINAILAKLICAVLVITTKADGILIGGG